MNYILARPGVNQFIPRLINEMREPCQEWQSRGDEVPTDYGTVFRWGCTANVPRTPTRRLINFARSIHAVHDKRGFRQVLQRNGIGPMTFFSVDEYAEYLRSRNQRTMQVIIRPETHQRGQQLFRANSPQEAAGFCNRLGSYYITQFIDKVAEYRIFIANGRCVYVANKIEETPGSVVWQESFANVRWGSWPFAAVDLAIRGMNLSGLDFGGVDVMVDAEGMPYLLEINAAPSPCNRYIRQCQAAVFDYIIRNPDADNIPIGPGRGWRDYIHPAVENR